MRKWHIIFENNARFCNICNMQCALQNVLPYDYYHCYSRPVRLECPHVISDFDKLQCPILNPYYLELALHCILI